MPENGQMPESALYCFFPDSRRRLQTPASDVGFRRRGVYRKNTGSKLQITYKSLLQGWGYT